MLDRLNADSAVITEDPAQPKILFTDDTGRSWQPVVNPCQGLQPSGLVAPTSAHWILYCFTDHGMNQGSALLASTTNSGATWTVTARAAFGGLTVGNIGVGTRFDLTASDSGRVLWSLSPVYGLDYSTDGGRNWHHSFNTGGDGMALATAGTEAWLPLPGIGLYRSLNGLDWKQLR